MRVKNLSNQLAAYEKEKGLQGEHASTPLEAFIETYRDKNDVVYFPFYIDKFLSDKNYKTATVIQKLAILTELITSVAPFIQHYEKDLFKKRYDKIKSEIEKLKIDLKDQKQAKAFGEFIDTILLIDRDLLWLSYKMTGIDNFKAHPVGKLGEFHQLCLAFVACQNEEQGRALAKKINALVKNSPGIIDWGSVTHWYAMQFFTMPAVVRPSKYRIFQTVDSELPWNRHLEWAKIDIEVRDVLENLGVLQLVRGSYPEGDKAALGFDLEYKFSEMRSGYHAVISGIPGSSLGYDSQIIKGRLVYKEPETYVKDVFLSFSEEEKYLKKQDKLAKDMVIDWELLEKDSSDFTAKYKEFLMPYGYMPGGFVFAERVMEKIAELDSRDPVKADDVFSKLLRFAPMRGRHNRGVEKKHYHLGISTKHPFIEHAFKNHDKFWREIPRGDLFYYQSKRLILRSSVPPDYSGYSPSSWPLRAYKNVKSGYDSAKDLLVSQYSKLTSSMPSIEERWQFYEYDVYFNLRRPKIFHNLKDDPTLLQSKKWVKRAYSINNLLKISVSLYPEIWTFEAYRIFKNNPYLHLSLDELAYLQRASSTLKSDFSFNPYGEENELLAIYQPYLDQHEQKCFVEALKSSDPDYLIRCYHFFHQVGKVFDDYNNIKKFEARMRAVYETFTSLAEKKRFLDQLLLTELHEFEPKFNLPPLEAQFSFTDITFKHWVIDEYSQALSESWGKDIGQDLIPPENASEASWLALQRHEEQLPVNPLYAKVDSLINRAPLSVSVPVLRRVANNIEAQKPLSFFIRDRLEHASTDNLLKQGVSFGAFGEMLLTEIPQSSDKRLRTDTIKFLLNSDENFDLDAYARRLCRGTQLRIKGAQKWAKDDTSIKDQYENNKEYVLERLRATRDLYQDLSFEQKILVMDQFLFPTENPVSLLDAKKLVLDALFDSNQISETNLLLANALTGKTVDSFREGEDESRQIVESYLEGLEEVAKDSQYKASIEARERLILSAMLIANANSQQTTGAASGRGEALNQVLAAMGPAGRKLAQAIESHTETPEDIKHSLQNSKTNAAPPTRWEVHEWAESFYQPAANDLQLADGIQHMGEMLGAGSYGVTMKVVKNSGAETAITFLRPFMREQARDEFMILDTAAQILIGKNPVFRPFDDMQREAAIASGKEVDMTISSKQQEFAKQLYEGLEIVINQHKFRFGVASWIGHGEQYKETKVVAGQHYNDLDQSAELKHLKKPAAAAILAAEIYLLLKGGHVDNDRHGGQQKLIKISENETYIGNFDFGGMSLRPQTVWQKKLLGQLVGEAMWQISKPIGAHQLDGSLLAMLTEKYVQAYAKAYFTGADGKEYLIGMEKAKHFVGQVKRGLLALGNYLSVLSQDVDLLKAVMGAVLATGQIDKTVEAGIREKLGRYEGKLDELAQSKEAQRITITRRSS
ncbi:MAG: hypothetical protein P4M14_04150 [Gammaproteobacteria bacterium]|nr:hypothetical protein [Gammaproteobacteria bacterium]